MSPVLAWLLVLLALASALGQLFRSDLSLAARSRVPGILDEAQDDLSTFLRGLKERSGSLLLAATEEMLSRFSIDPAARRAELEQVYDSLACLDPRWGYRTWMALVLLGGGVGLDAWSSPERGEALWGLAGATFALIVAGAAVSEVRHRLLRRSACEAAQQLDEWAHRRIERPETAFALPREMLARRKGSLLSRASRVRLEATLAGPKAALALAELEETEGPVPAAAVEAPMAHLARQAEWLGKADPSRSAQLGWVAGELSAGPGAPQQDWQVAGTRAPSPAWTLARGLRALLPDEMQWACLSFEAQGGAMRFVHGYWLDQAWRAEVLSQAPSGAEQLAAARASAGCLVVHLMAAPTLDGFRAHVALRPKRDGVLLRWDPELARKVLSAAAIVGPASAALPWRPCHSLPAIGLFEPMQASWRWAAAEPKGHSASALDSPAPFPAHETLGADLFEPTLLAWFAAQRAGFPAVYRDALGDELQPSQFFALTAQEAARTAEELRAGHDNAFAGD